MALNLTKTVIAILKRNPNKYFTARQLAECVFEEKKEECLQKKERSKATIIPIATNEALLTQIVAEIGSQRDRIANSFNNIKVTTDRPKKYYYSNRTDEQEIREIEKNPTATSFSELDSYPFLYEYLFSELEIFPKRINEKTSSNSKGHNGNKWLHPDVVGLKDLSANWSKDVVDCVNNHSFNRTSLWSFEVKIKLNISNVRENFFQTVSNSSWANYSYLVAQSIDEKAMEELHILCARHKIGLIQLNCENPTESQILIPAAEKKELDWNMMDRISKENSDFRDFLNRITEFYQTGKIKKQEWDVPNQRQR